MNSKSIINKIRLVAVTLLDSVDIGGNFVAGDDNLVKQEALVSFLSILSDIEKVCIVSIFGHSRSDEI